MTKVKARKMYFDHILERDVMRGEIVEVADDRATKLENAGFVTVVEYAKYPAKTKGAKEAKDDGSKDN